MEKQSNLSLDIKDLPKVPEVAAIIGPSLIILGISLGSGEIILWPYLSSNWGLGIIWGALVGITLQFFLNMEAGRYALLFGESIFVGFARLFKLLPIWFILTSFLGFAWPGIGVASATILGNVLGIGNVRLLAIGFLVLIGVILTLGRVLYNTVENFERYAIGIGAPFLLVLALYLATKADFQALGLGLLGRGEGFNFLPEGISFMTFLGALAFSGAGGNLNLAQSFYIREKGYGMGAYAKKIKRILWQHEEAPEVCLTGTTFKPTKENIARFKKWWKFINVEHFVVFWFLGLLSILLLSLLAYSTVYGLPSNVSGVSFVLNEASVIASQTFPFVASLFLVVVGVLLFGAQLGVLESTSRIMTENYLLLRDCKGSVSETFYAVLWAQIIFGSSILLLGFDEPVALIVLAAVINAFTMFINFGLVLFLNNKVVEKPLRPSWVRNAVLAFAFIFFGVFSALTLFSKMSPS